MIDLDLFTFLILIFAACAALVLAKVLMAMPAFFRTLFTGRIS